MKWMQKKKSNKKSERKIMKIKNESKKKTMHRISLIYIKNENENEKWKIINVKRNKLHKTKYIRGKP